LFENSIKYRRSEPLKIHVSAHLQGEDWVVSVADNGIGIPKHDLHRVFEIFRRSGNVSGARGVGLGLSIVKRIIERHGGIIWLESVLGTGTTVFFTFGKDRAIGDIRSILAQADKANAKK
jgi:signal transduction histidine kinase